VDSSREFSQALLLLGVSCPNRWILFFGGQLPFRLGALPGDIVHKSENTTVYFDHYQHFAKRWLISSTGLSADFADSPRRHLRLTDVLLFPLRLLR
jgi:hypothetical protein